MPTPYSVLCDACGNELVVTKREMDNEWDVLVTAEPCKTCLEETREKTRKEVEDEYEVAGA